MNGRKRIDELIGSLAIGVFLEPQRNVLVVLVQRGDPFPIMGVETLGSRTGGHTCLNRLLNRRDGDVAHLGERRRAPRVGDIPKVAFWRGGVVIPASPEEGESSYAQRPAAPIGPRKEAVKRILHEQFV